MAAGVNDGGSKDRVSGTPTRTLGRGDEYGIPLEGDQSGQKIPDLSYDKGGSEGGGHEDLGAVAWRPSEVAPAKHTPNDDQIGEGAQHVIRSGGSGGERRYPSDILASTDIYQLQRGTGMT